jgi:hypothetical protein
MKRFVLTVCCLVVAALALSPALFAVSPASPSELPALTASCGDTAAVTAKAADLPSFLAGVRLAATCTTTCTQERMLCRQQCAEPSCSVGYFSCSATNPCAAVCECFCL